MNPSMNPLMKKQINPAQEGRIANKSKASQATETRMVAVTHLPVRFRLDMNLIPANLLSMYPTTWQMISTVWYDIPNNC
jgi:hypothetical protein